MDFESVDASRLRLDLVTVWPSDPERKRDAYLLHFDVKRDFLRVGLQMVQEMDVEIGVLEQEPPNRGRAVPERGAHELFKGDPAELEVALGLDSTSDCPCIKRVTRRRRKPAPRDRLQGRDTRPSQNLLDPLHMGQVPEKLALAWIRQSNQKGINGIRVATQQ